MVWMEDAHAFQLVIRDRIIWNCKQFISNIARHGKIFDGKEMLLQLIPTDPNFIKLSVQRFILVLTEMMYWMG
jgi:hypothetical protein